MTIRSRPTDGPSKRARFDHPGKNRSYFSLSACRSSHHLVGGDSKHKKQITSLTASFYAASASTRGCVIRFPQVTPGPILPNLASVKTEGIDHRRVGRLLQLAAGLQRRHDGPQSEKFVGLHASLQRVSDKLSIGLEWSAGGSGFLNAMTYRSYAMRRCTRGGRWAL